MNLFRLDLEGAQPEMVAVVRAGRVEPVSVLRRNQQQLPLAGIYGLVYSALQTSGELQPFLIALKQRLGNAFADIQSRRQAFKESLLCLESLAAQGWVHCSRDPAKAVLSMRTL
jgi:hypothetical protein